MGHLPVAELKFVVEAQARLGVTGKRHKGMVGKSLGKSRSATSFRVRLLLTRKERPEPARLMTCIGGSYVYIVVYSDAPGLGALGNRSGLGQSAGIDVKRL
jgi:hypothetical protein